MNDNESKSKCDPSKLKEGDWLSGTVYYQVMNAVSQTHFHMKDNFGSNITVGNKILAREMTSSQQFEETKEMCRSDMVELLMNAKDTVFTAKFRKQLTGKRLREVLDEEDYCSSTPSKKGRVLTKALKNGESRELVGYLKESEPFMGRSSVIDLNIPHDQYRTRLIDHRTLEELIMNNVKYVLK